MAKDFSTATRLPEDFAHFDFAESSAATNLEWPENISDEVEKAECMRLHRVADETGFTMDSNLEGLKAAIEKAAMDRLKEDLDERDLRGITVEASNGYVNYLCDGNVFATQYGLINIDDKYMEDGEYPIIPYAGEPDGIGSNFIGENGGYGYSEEAFVDFLKVEEGLAANREFAAEVGGLEGPDEGLQK